MTDDDDTFANEDSPWISQEWKDTILLHTQENRTYRDESFPPNESSLDGRPRAVAMVSMNNNNHTTESKPIPKNPYKKTSTPAATMDHVTKTDTEVSPATLVLCKCGIPASLKTVQSDGPNYGRPYLSCGRPYSKSSTLHKKCPFFQWDNSKDGGGNTLSTTRWTHKVTWFHVVPSTDDMIMNHSITTSTPFCISRHTPSAQDVKQGRLLGNCWFLSALAVVAEKPFLIHRLIPIRHLNKVGCYTINFYLDGCWESILIDSYLPILENESSSTTLDHAMPSSPLSKKRPRHLEKKTIHPAFAAWPQGILWPALIEKAYAKVHGSYKSLHGGFISEAFQDLTGAPTERLYLTRYRLSNTMMMRRMSYTGSHPTFPRETPQVDELWVKLLSFSSAGFVMGAATSSGGDGIVPCHAYSILNILEIHDAIQGEQQKVTDFFSSNDRTMNRKETNHQDSENKRETLEIQDSDDEVIFLGTSTISNNSKQKKSDADDNNTTKESIRLVHLRNPWGQKEFKGTWSVNSEKWTCALRKQVGSASFQHGDGTFFMSLDEFITRFDHVDVSKSHEVRFLCSPMNLG